MPNATLQTLRRRLLPFLYRTESHNTQTVLSDFYAAVLVTLLLVPQVLGYASLAGLSPVHGLYAALLSVAIGAIWGSSPYLSTGPDAVSSILTATALTSFVASGTQQYAVYAALLAVMVGLIRLVMGLAGQGYLLYFIPHSIIKAFTCIAGIVIVSTQIPVLMGISGMNPESVIVMIHSLLQSLSLTHLPTLAMGLSAILAIVLLRSLLHRSHMRIPSSLIVLCIGTLVSYLAPTITTGIPLVGDIPNILPSLQQFTLDWNIIQTIITSSFIIAIIGFSEAYAIAESISQKQNEQLDIDQELVGQGLASISSGLLGGYPISGSMSRTVINHNAGARSYLSGVWVSILLFGIILWATPVLAYIPRTVLAATIIVGVWPLIDLQSIRHIWHLKRSDGIIAIITICIGILFKIEYALLVGIILSLVSFLRMVAIPRVVELGWSRDMYALRSVTKHPELELLTVPTVLIVRIDMSLVYINSKTVIKQLSQMVNARPHLQTIICECSGINAIDATGLHELEYWITTLRRNNVSVLLYRVKSELRELLSHTTQPMTYIESIDDIVEQLSPTTQREFD